jgi:5-methylcytosine-specific restriction enzyme A
MFSPEGKYSKNDIYEILNVPLTRRKGAWDTGYREFDGNIYIFSNVGIPGRTGHDYNNYWDGDLFKWESKTNSNIKQPLIKRMLDPLKGQKIYLFTRTNDKDPFTFEGEVFVLNYSDSVPVRITWELKDNIYFPLENVDKSGTSSSELISEGSKNKIIINKFERSPLARRLCVEHYGAFCRICGFDFYNAYAG